MVLLPPRSAGPSPFHPGGHEFTLRVPSCASRSWRACADSESRAVSRTFHVQRTSRRSAWGDDLQFNNAVGWLAEPLPLPDCSLSGVAFRVLYPGHPGDRRVMRSRRTLAYIRMRDVRARYAGAGLGSGRGDYPSVTLPRGVHRPGQETRDPRRPAGLDPGANSCHGRI